MQLPKLNFEDIFDFQIRTDKDKFFIYDAARKSWLQLTPEEWVRQHWIHYFHYAQKRNFSSLILEKKLELNGTTKRIDLLVTEKTKPKILVECKAPDVKLTEKTFEQIARYNSIIGAEEILLSNGVQHINARLTENGYEFFKFEFHKV